MPSGYRQLWWGRVGVVECLYFSLHHFNAPIINRLWNPPFCYFLDVYFDLYADYLEISHWCKCTLKSNAMLFIFCLFWCQPFYQSPIIAIITPIARKMGRKDKHVVHIWVLVINSESLPNDRRCCSWFCFAGGCNRPALNWYPRGANIPRIQFALDLRLVNGPLGFKINSTQNTIQRPSVASPTRETPSTIFSRCSASPAKSACPLDMRLPL